MLRFGKDCAWGRQPVVVYQRAGNPTVDLFALAVNKLSQELAGLTVLTLPRKSRTSG
jgi:hypothetical protein